MVKKKRSCSLKCKPPQTVCVSGYTREINVIAKPNSKEYNKMLRKAGIF